MFRTYQSACVVTSLLVTGLILSTAVACGQNVSEKSDAYRQEVIQWWSAHEEKFRSPKGWLALVGHYWLSEGDNTFGTSKDSAVPLPQIPGLNVNGNIRLSKNRVSIQVDPGSQVMVNEKAIAETVLAIDPSEAETDGTDSITIGDRLRLQLVRRNNRFAIRVRDSQSPLIAGFKGKRWRAIDSRYRVEATFTKFDTPKIVKIINIKGDETESRLVGQVKFTLDQRTFSLDALADSPTELFFVFKDLTCGESSYGAGRFLDVTLESEANQISTGQKVILDFNKAYSPPCAYSPHTLCPLPPPQNHLDIAIDAGETIDQSK